MSMDRLKTRFEQEGYLDPVKIFSPGEIHDLWSRIKLDLGNPPLDWDKGYAAGSRLFFEIGTQKDIIALVERLIGKDILLWGASIVSKAPGAIHPWHCDIESSTIERGNTVSVWIGLENTSLETSLSLIPFTHHFERTVQEIRSQKGKPRMQTTSEEILGWAQIENKQCSIVQTNAGDGDALFFQGKIWHYSKNSSGKTRTALLLQYATPDARIRIQDPNCYDWPFQQINQPRPPCILVKGDDRFGVNRIIPPPGTSKIKSRIAIQDNRIHPLNLPLSIPDDVLWKPFYIFNGRTAELEHITCHISALRNGHQPHPPHQHREEEILVVLEGAVDVILPEFGDQESPYRKRLTTGQFVYYPAFFTHTIEGISTQPANYLMIKWYNEVNPTRDQIPYGLYDIFEKEEGVPVNIRYRKIFEGPTGCLERLHCHSTVIPAGASYAAHIDPYDVAIIVLEGIVETAGERVNAGSLIFYPAGQPHGMYNPGQEEARYVVFEFHRAKVISAAIANKDKGSSAVVANIDSRLDVLQSQIERKRKELQDIQLSYSWKMGRLFTSTIMGIFGWSPKFRKWIDQLAKENIRKPNPKE